MIKRLKEQPLVRTDRAGDQMGAVVYYDTDWEEYRVVPTINGLEQPSRTHYHTDDRDDAYRTAAVMIVRASNL